MIRNGSPVKGAKVNVLGLTFKENCPDIRNTRVIDVIRELQAYDIDVHVHDPVSDAAEAHHEYGLDLEAWESLPRATRWSWRSPTGSSWARPLADFVGKIVDGGCFIDVKCQFDVAALRKAGLTVWRL